MRPKSLSATALKTAGLCLARYKAEHIDYGRGMSNDAALLGSSVHGALELWVKTCILEPKNDPTLKLLLDYFQLSYVQIYGSSDFKSTDYKDGVKMLKDWFERTDFSLFTVISCERKENFPLPMVFDGVKEEVPFNYIFDRHDQIDATTHRIVDYKTNRAPVSPEELRGKVQAKAYGLAMQIKYPDAQRIWVEFDMLRHGGPVGTVFTKEDNVATWKFLKSEAQRIADADDSKPLPETINEECGFCVRKANCQAVFRNIKVGGAFSLDPLERVDQRATLYNQKKAIEAALKELDGIILAEAQAADIIEFDGHFNRQIITARSTRYVDPDMAFHVIGPDLARRYGGSKLSMGAVDALLSGDELTAEQKSQLSGLIRTNKGEPYVQSKAKPRT